MSQVYDIANQYVDKIARLNPVAATMRGIPGHDAEMTDFSPEGVAASDALNRETLVALSRATVEGERDRIARETMEDELKLRLEQSEAREHLRDVGVLRTPLQSIRLCFDLMPRATLEDWRNIAARLGLVPQGLASYRTSLEEGMRRNLVAARRQAIECATQAEVWSGQKGGTSFFDGVVANYNASGISNSSLRRDLEKGARDAASAYAHMARFYRDIYSAKAQERDAVGRERYSLSSRLFNGIALDLNETYAWGWEQLRWVEEEMAATAEKIFPGGGVEAAKQMLENDPSRAIEGVEPFKEWMQGLQDKTIAALDGAHFDISGPVRRIEAMIAPPGGALAMYYTGPSEDFARPGRTWYPTGGKTRFPLWGEVSIAYHEGVPGHHLQHGTTTYLKDELSRYQRLIGGCSGYAEGWALYAERLMGELGYLDTPDYYLGMLRAQALRSVRVIIDIGMHLELTIPRGQPYHPGERWTPELGGEFLKERSHFPADFLASELARYLGTPGQAISYKVGERVWLESRQEARRRLGPAFNLKAWHNRALRIGPMGLALMKKEMSRL